MRFTMKSGKSGPSFSGRLHQFTFLSMAAAELALLALSILLFIRFRNDFDPATLGSTLLVVLALGSWYLHRGLLPAHIIFFASLLSLEMLLLTTLPTQPIDLWIYQMPFEYLLWAFVILDLLVLGALYNYGSASQDENEG